MTTKPKVLNFRRIRRQPLMRKVGTIGEPDATMPDKVSDGFGDAPYPTAAKQPADDAQARLEIEAIRAEGLTGRQLRVARRLAQRMKLEARNDHDAVRVLRANGIDPFQKSAVLELVVPKGKSDGNGNAKQNLPEAVPASKVPAQPKMYDEAMRALEVHRIQQEIAARRRRKLFSLFARLAVFVLIPTIFVGYYFYNMATPLYSTKSEILIQKADSQGASGLSGLFSGTGFANSQDSIAVQSYLGSRDAMLRLDADIGFKSHFSQPGIDFLRRLPEDSSNERAYKLYQKMVRLSYDPTEGIIKMEVIAADPNVSEAYAIALINYAEEQVDQLTQRLREDQMKGSRQSYQDAEAKMLAAQQKVLELQERLGIIDAASETSALMGQITQLENQIVEKRLELQQLLDNSRPNQARVAAVRGDIARMEDIVGDLRSELTESGADSSSLARITAEMRLAEIDLETRTAMMQQSLEQLEMARIEANRQVRYLSLGVSPVAPDDPAYPRAFENTVVAMLIFSGIYLMMSLTAAILREQVSA